MDNAVVKTGTSIWLTIPDNSNTALSQFSHNVLILDYILNYPSNFLSQLTQKIFADSSEKLNPHIRNTFKASFKDSVYFIGQFFYLKATEMAPYILTALKTSKSAVRLMLSDIFEAFVSPLTQTISKDSLSLNGGIAIGMIGVSLLTHEFAQNHLKEDPEQAKSITYGAITGTISSYIMDHNIFIGTLAGASVGLIADTAVACITYNSLATFFKTLYKKLKIQERAGIIHSFASKVFPYIFFTLGTALIYSRISPLLTKIMEEEGIPSKKIHVIKVLASSGMLFGMGKSYFTPLLKSFLIHIKIGAQSAHDTGIIASWAPRILAITCVTTLVSNLKK